MQDMELRLLWWQQLLGPVVILAGCLLLLGSPILFPWRIAAVTVLLVGGLFIWGGHLRARPHRLKWASDGRLTCVRGTGQETEIERVRIGVAHPRLLSARLTLVDGRGCDLWVPGEALPPDLHRQLRARLLGFRPR